MKKIFLLPTFTFLFVLVNSCSKQVLNNANLQTNIATDKWSSTAELESLIAGAYYGISGYAGNVGIIGQQHTNEAFLSDLGYLHTNAVTGNFETDLYNRVNTRNDMSVHASMWQGAYMGIALCNEIIGWIDTRGAFKDQNGPIWTNRILGEALFLRAWTYFTIVRIWGPAYGSNNEAKSVILKLNPSKEAFENPGRSTVKQVYDQMLSDLNRAVQLLPLAFNPLTDPVGYQDRANRYAARFLLAQIYFQMKDLNNSKIQCDSVLNSGRFPLTEDPIQAWNKTGPGARGKEVIWQYAEYSTSQQQWKSSPIGSYMGFTARGSNTINSGRILSASDAFLNQAGWNANTLVITDLPGGRPPAVIPNADNYNISNPDKRLAQLWKAIPAGYDPRPEFTGYTRNYVWCNKWNRLTTVNNNLFSLPFMRSAELYLTRAIINFTNGDLNGATADLNIVRSRAGLTAIPVASLTADNIHIERMRELAFENDRLYYLQALGLSIPPGDRTGAAPLDWKSASLVMPLPAVETDVNPGASN